MEILNIAAAVEKIRLYLKRDTLRSYFVISDGKADFKKFFCDRSIRFAARQYSRDKQLLRRDQKS